MENLLAKELGFVIEPDHLADAIASGRQRRIDLGRAGDRHFTLMLTAGFDADVAHRLAHWRAKPGRLRNVRHASYLRPIAASTLRYRFDSLELSTDDGHSCRGALAMVFNIARYGFGLSFVRGARHDDGLLHWVVLTKPGRARTLAYLAAVLRGTHLQRRDVRHGTARHVRLQSENPVPIQMDGDEAGFTPVTVDVQPQALAVVDTALPASGRA